MRAFESQILSIHKVNRVFKSTSMSPQSKMYPKYDALVCKPPQIHEMMKINHLRFQLLCNVTYIVL